MKKFNSYNIQIWVGLKETYDEKKLHSISEVYEMCSQFVNEIKDCVSITPTRFEYVGGGENGAVVGYINYPRFPRSKRELRRRSFLLAERLMIGLNQYRVTITTPNKSYMLENKNVER